LIFKRLLRIGLKNPLFLGDILNDDGILLADFLEHFGENVLRFEDDQSIHLRNIPEVYIGNVFNLIKKMKTISNLAPLIGQMIACTGAATCKLGICLPRGVTPAIQQKFEDGELDLDKLGEFKIHISGCPNTCGQHHIADLGFFGKVGRKDGQMYPLYNVLAGAVVEDGKTQFSQKIDDIAAHDLPHFVYDFLELYLTKQDNYATFLQYIETEGKEDIKRLCDKYRNVPSFDENKNYYFDWGSKEQFSILKGQRAECSAGVFDMIDVEVNSIKSNKEKLATETDSKVIGDILYKMIYASSHMLLVTRGIEAKSDKMTFENFIQHFIEANLIPGEFKEIVTKARQTAAAYDGIDQDKDQIIRLADKMVELYKSMDDSLRFKTEKEDQVDKKVDSVDSKESSNKIRLKDLRGVGCPINFVKVKIELENVKPGEKLEVYF